MEYRNVKIIGTGAYLPKQLVPSTKIDEKLKKKSGWTEKTTGVRFRYFVEDETASKMGSFAAKEAMNNAGLTHEQIDCIVCASGTSEQEIPCTAALVQRELGDEFQGIPSFDINTTCLSFVTGLDIMSTLVASGMYQNVLIVSTEVASVGLNWDDNKTAGLFGDGAAAAIISTAEDAKIICSKMSTYSSGASYSQIRGGGTKVHPRNERKIEPFLFEMDGKAIFKLAAKTLPPFVKSLLSQANLQLSDIDLVITHQASGTAMRLLARRLGIDSEKLMYILPHYGNMIAASIPLALHKAIEEERINRGDRILLLGTSAGLSLGGLIIEY